MLLGIPDVLWYAVIIAIFSLISPLILARVTARNTRLDRAEDWARQDAVAAKAAHAAELLLASNTRMAEKAAEAARLLVADNKEVAKTTGLIITKLDVVHTLVNSNMTAAMQSEYDAVKRELVLMKELIALHQSAGREPSPDALTEVKITEGKVAELNATLKDRLKATEEAAAVAQAPVNVAPPASDNVVERPSTDTPG
jgi:hypothetical protein